MKRHTLFLLFLTLVAGASTAFAQTAGATRPAAPAGAVTATPTASADTGKVAVVYTELFVDPKTGIASLVSAASSVDREFQPRSTELETMQRQIQTATDALQKVAAVQEETKSQAEKARIEKMRRDYEYKAQEAQADYGRRRAEVLSPHSEKINTALQAFARQRGISVLIDGSKLTGAVMVLNDSVDVTNEFIADYNRRNPATAAAATPPARR